MKVVSLVGQCEQEMLTCAELLATEFKQRGLKLGLFIQKNEQKEFDQPFHGRVVRYENQTLWEVGEAFDLENLLSICCCDMLVGIHMQMSGVQKVVLQPPEEGFQIAEDMLCILNDSGKKQPFVTIPTFQYNKDIPSLASYLWLNATEIINNKNIQLNEEFIKYADTAQKNVAVVKIKSQYGFEMNCIKKSFVTESASHQEAFYAGILNSTLKIYPQIIDVVKTILYREFIDGDKLHHVIQQHTSDASERSFYYLESILLSVVDTINYIHNELANYYKEDYCIGNTRFENFLVAEDTVFYLDLNGICYGDPVADFESFTAGILGSEFIRTNDKRNLVNSIIQYVNNGFYYKRTLKWDGVEVVFQEIEK